MILIQVHVIPAMKKEKMPMKDLIIITDINTIMSMEIYKKNKYYF